MIDFKTKEHIIVSFCLFAFSLLNAIKGDFYIFLLLSATSDYIDSLLLKRIDENSKIYNTKEILIHLYRITKQLLVLFFVLFRMPYLKPRLIFTVMIGVSLLLENMKLIENIGNVGNNLLPNNLFTIKNMSLFRYVLYAIFYKYLN